MGLPGSSAGKESTSSAEDPGSIPELRRFPWRINRLPTSVFLGFPGDSDGKEPACNVEDLGLIPELGRSPGEEYGNPLHYAGLEKPHGWRRLAGYSPWGYKESDTTEHARTHTHTHIHTHTHTHIYMCVHKYIYIKEGNGTPLQYSRLENPMDRGAWQATVHGIAGLNTTVGLTFTFSH